MRDTKSSLRRHTRCKRNCTYRELAKIIMHLNMRRSQVVAVTKFLSLPKPVGASMYEYAERSWSIPASRSPSEAMLCRNAVLMSLAAARTFLAVLACLPSLPARLTD